MAFQPRYSSLQTQTKTGFVSPKKYVRRAQCARIAWNTLLNVVMRTAYGAELTGKNGDES